ncbi:hypothetical protein, partial [Novosphingobium sp. KN65.2]|uniref:hypothetical protein n=1 Tax=Novosphingobium sp. KN65.2 TaxID=1478134 RepID=UPI000B022173
MPEKTNHVRRISVFTKAQVSAKLAIGWARATANRKGAFADAIDIDAKTVNRTLTGETVPELHTALNSLVFDPTALDEVFALYGVKITPLQSEAANDLHTISSLSNLAGQFASALEDGHRDHRETCQLADAARPLMQALAAICAEADAV